MGKTTGFIEYNREEPEKRSIEERVKDYKEVYEKIPEDKIQIQGARCMECGTPFCMWGCPLGNLIPDFNDMVYKGEWKKAYERLILTNNFPEFTGRVCPAPCEGSCTLGVNRLPVTIHNIEHYIIEKAFEEGYVITDEPRVRTGKKVAVIGSGPSGLAAAAELNSVGHDVTVFERADEPGGLLRYGIPDFKLEKSIVARRIDILKKVGIKFKVNTQVGVDYPADKLCEDFDAVVLCCGSTVPRDLKAEGRELEGISFAVDYLRQQNKRVSGKSVDEKEITAKDKVVLVIGGGDTGSDCIGTAIRQGAKKVYQYEIMPKAPEVRDETMPWPTFPKTFKVTTSHEEGCVRDFCISTNKFIGKNGKLTGIAASKVEWSKGDDGRMIMSEIPGSEFTQDFDLVLIAMGFLHTEGDLLKKLNIDVDVRGNVKTDSSFMTSRKGIFSAGDMRRGQSLVVWAIHEGRSAAKAVDKYLMGESPLRG